MGQLNGSSSASKNDDFNQNYNMSAHNQRMAELSRGYGEHDINYSKSMGRKAETTEEKFQQINRKTAMYKPSIQIDLQQKDRSSPQIDFHVKFQYDSEVDTQTKSHVILSVYVGVNSLEEDETTQITKHIEADEKIKEIIPSGKKQLFEKHHSLGLNASIKSVQSLLKKQLILRFESSLGKNQPQTEATEYTLIYNAKEQHWKIILEKYETDNKAFELENVYGAGGNENGDGEECIVCMCEKSTTIVKPCNHLCLCRECSVQINNKTRKCPICRKDIQRLVTIG